MTTPTPPTATQALQQARQALQRGDKRAVRQWAEQALAQDAAQEEPWLLLAAVSTPRASVEYLQRALSLNPHSARAQKGLEWARQRLSAVETAPSRPAAVSAPPAQTAEPSPAAAQPVKSVWDFLVEKKAPLPLTVLILACVLGAALLFGGATSVRAFLKTMRKPLQTTTVAEMTSAVAAVHTPLPTASPSVSELSASPSAPASILPSASPSAPVSAPEPTPTPLPTDMPASVQTDQPAPEQAAPEYAGGKLILVDLSEQHMYVYENDSLVYSFVVSTGMGGGTRVGTFYIQNKIPNAYGSTWDLWMPNWMGIYWSGPLQNGIHALPILSNGQRLWAGYLGTPVSYGCVILGVYEAELLYEWAEIGIPVIIQY